MNSDFKENYTNSSLNDSIKRRKMEQKTINNQSLDLDESDANVTVYDEPNDLNYFNKSSRNRLLCKNKRSPLTLVNNPLPNAHKNQQQQQQQLSIGSSTSQPSTSSAKTPCKLIESNYRRYLQKKAPVDPFNSLSDEIILHIFEFLPKKALQRIACVNSRFCRISHDESLWIRMDLGNKSLRRGSIGKILNTGLVILRLAQARIQSPLFESHFILEGFQSKLQYLDLSMASIDKYSLAQLLSKCRLLKKLSLEQLQIDDEVCTEVANNKNLEVLNLTMCEGFTKFGVKTLMGNLNSLLALNVSWTSLNKDGMDEIVSKISPTIMRLNISGSRSSLPDASVQILVGRCPNLVELDLSDCTMLTSTSINTIATLTKLEYLSVSRCYNIPMAAYLVLHNVKSLLYLDVFGLLSENGLQMFEKTFKNIGINKFIHSSVARPTVMPRRTSIWGLRTRD